MVRVGHSTALKASGNQVGCQQMTIGDTRLMLTSPLAVDRPKFKQKRMKWINGDTGPSAAKADARRESEDGGGWAAARDGGGFVFATPSAAN